MISLGTRSSAANRLLLLTGAIFFCLTSLAHAAPMLNGIATYSEFNKERFLAALYTESPSTDAATLFDTNQVRRMEVRITADNFSGRRLGKMWIEGMAINNSSTTLTEQADNMVTFTNLLKKPLILGDRLSIDYQPGLGTQIKVNDVLLGQIASPSFFDTLLRTWIGNVPLSSELRDSLLKSGQIDSNLLARFNSLSPNPALKQATAEWVLPIDADATVAATDTATTTATQNIADVAATAAPALPPPTIEVEVSAPTAEDSAASVAPKVQAPTLNIPTPASISASAAASGPALSEDDLEEKETADEPALTAETLLSRQIYHSKLMRKIYGNIRYPKRAIDRGYEGSVRLSVTIDRQGNLLKTSVMAASTFDLLNEAALSAVNKTAPYLPVPNNISGDTFTFSLPIEFRLPK